MNRVAALVLPVALLGGCESADSAESPPAPVRPPNIVLYMTDDQRADTTWVLESVHERLAARGLTFERAYVNTPLCCPARASVLSGGFLAQTTGVLTNSDPDGGATQFVDTDTLPVRLQRAGYRTLLVGKYLNGFGDLGNYVPPGWDQFEAVMPFGDWSAFSVISGSSGPDASTEAESRMVQQYITEYIGTEARAFVAQESDQPFFAWVAHYAPHYPAIPAAGDEAAFADVTWRGGAYDEADVSDKPAWVQATPPIDDAVRGDMDAVYQDYLESLLEVDRQLDAMLDTLEKRDQLDNTLFVFTSDNGYLFGEHRQFDKGIPYEESIHVPLVILAPGGATGSSDELVSVTTDLGATFYAAAGLDAPTQGQSLLPLLEGEPYTSQVDLLIEGYHLAAAPDYAGLVTADHTYIEYVTGEAELYDRAGDPAQEVNLAGHPASADRVAELAARLAGRKGLTLTSAELDFEVGVAVDRELTAWGGTPPYTWSADGRLPDGLTLDPAGRITGEATQDEERVVVLQVQDSSASAYTGAAQRYHERVVVRVGAAAAPPPPPSVEVEGRAARVRAAARRGWGDVDLAWSPDPDFDVFVRRATVRPGADGVAELGLEGLTPGACYWVRVEEPEPRPDVRFCVGR